MPQAPAVAEGKYQLKSLHQEIDLFDRKLAHLLKYDAFETDAARAAAAKKMNAKRELLVKNAAALVAEGVEFSPSELPRSLRPKDTPMPVAPEPVAEEAKPEFQAAGASRGERRSGSAYAGTSLDWEKGIREYMSKKAKA